MLVTKNPAGEVLARFDPEWPSLKVGVACFGAIRILPGVTNKTDHRIAERALACAVKALPAHKQTTKNVNAIRDAIRASMSEGTRDETDLAQIGILAVD